MKLFHVLPRLPSTDPRAIEFPSGWGHAAREGLVVENLSPHSSWD